MNQPADPSSRHRSHLVPVRGGWSAWRWVVLRGAGFPAQHLLALGAERSAALADQTIAQEGTLRRRVLDVLGQLPIEPVTGDRAENKVRRRRRLLLERVAAEEPLARETLTEIAAALPAEAATLGELAATTADLSATFDRESTDVSAALRRAAAEPAFREAMIWQNRNALRTGSDKLAAAPVGRRDSQTRQHERMVASYLQRYCSKNESIGFFGPVGWARWVDEGPAVGIRVGPALVARRRVDFEGWTIDALAAKLTALDGIRPWLRPRLLPYFHLDGTRLHIPTRPPVDLPPEQARVLAMCDGTVSARDIAHRLADGGDGPAPTVEELCAQLEVARGMGIIAWALEVPEHPRPETLLEARLREIGDPAIRDPGLAALAELTSARDAVASAAGDADLLDHAMGRLEETFTRLTGQAPTRNEGKVFAARTLVYEDCQRDVEVDLGPQLMERLAAPLELLLVSARWFTLQVARRYRAAMRELHAAAAAQAGDGPVDIATVHAALMRTRDLVAEKPMLETPPAISEIMAELQRRWSVILDVRPGERRIERRSADLAARVAEAFEAPGPGWPAARHLSPDVLIAASDVDAFARGEFQAVVGEIHISNSMMASLFTKQHPRPEDLLEAVHADQATPFIVPMLPKEFQLLRNSYGFLEQDRRIIHYEFSPDPPPEPRDNALRAGDLVMEVGPAGDVVRTRDGSRSFDIIEFLGMLLSVFCSGDFSILPGASHSPRITVDGVVIWREKWQFPVSTLRFATGTEPLDRFREMRRWATRSGLPRFLFIKVPVERKPTFVDLHAPPSAEIVSRLVRVTAESDPAGVVSFSEMLPALDQAWLPDGEGRRYTSELRMVMLDPKPWCT